MDKYKMVAHPVINGVVGTGGFANLNHTREECIKLITHYLESGDYVNYSFSIEKM